MRQDFLLQIHRTIRNMHRRNRTVASAYGSGTGMLELAIIQEVIGNPALQSQQIAKRCRVSPVQISRAVDALRRNGLLDLSTGPKDRRTKQLTATARGRQLCAGLQTRSLGIWQAAYERLSPEERPRFTEYLQRMLNTYGAPNAGPLPGDPPLILEIRRITRMMGLFTTRVFGVQNLSPLRWHMLSAVCTAPDGVTVSHLSAAYGIRPTTISAVAQTMIREKLVSHRRIASDRRLMPLLATTAGLKEHRRIERIAVKQLADACHGFSDTELQDYAALWMKYSGAQFFVDDIALEAEAGIRRLSSPVELMEARRFLVTERVRQDLLQEIPDTFAHERSVVYGLIVSGNIEACAEFRARDSRWKLLHFIVGERAQHIEALLEYVLEQFFSSTSARQLELCGAAMSANIVRLIPRLSGRRSIVVSQEQLNTLT